MNFNKRSLWFCAALFALLCFGIGGCQSGNAITPAEEQQFKNPPKEIPPEALKVMREHSAQPPQAAAPNAQAPDAGAQGK